MNKNTIDYKFEQISASCFLLHFLPSEKNGLLTSVLLIAGIEHLFVVDTAYGSECMEIVKTIKAEKFPSKFIIVFNTHSHWDHVWGNNIFKNHPRFAHYLCAERIRKYDSDAQKTNSSFIRGTVETCLPDILFDSEICFAEEGVRFFHTPGHTEDSCSIWVENDRLLFAADNLESPLPYTEADDLMSYIQTLENYRLLQPDIIATSHSGVVPTALLDHTIYYLKNFDSAEKWLNKNSPEWQTHQVNKCTFGKNKP